MRRFFANADCSDGALGSVDGGTGGRVGDGAPDGNGTELTHPMANAKASKAITLLNRIALGGYYTQSETIQHVREGNQD